MLYLAPDLETWKMDNLLNLEIWTEDFLKLWNLCFAWESSTRIQNCFDLMVGILIIEWWMWNSFRASNAGKGILQCSGMGRYWELSGGLGASNLETIRVWYLIWSIFWDKWPKFSVWHSFWGPYFSSQSQSGMKPSCLDYLNFYRLGPEFRQNSEHFLTKMPRNWSLDSGTCSGLCGW